jgi:uncharacterized protein YndB with AHSA1/START domain
MTVASVRRTVQVPVDPATAFRLFTADIGTWWRPGPHSLVDPARAVGMVIEPRVGGRWLEVWDTATGEGYEHGRVTTWEPGRRLVIAYRHEALPPEPATEIDVAFEPAGAGTRVVLEHRGWERLPPEVVAAYVRPRMWGALMSWYVAYAAAASAPAPVTPAADR